MEARTMKKTLTLTILIFFSWSMTSLSAQSADEIVKKMIDAQGGKKVYESIKDMTVKGTLKIIQQGLEAEITIYKKEPDKRREDIEVMGMLITSAYDGTMAWGTNQQTMAVEEFTGEQLVSAKREAMPVIAPLYPEKFGITHSLKGKETIEGKEYWVLERDYPNDFKIMMFLDTETYLPYKTVATIVDAMGTEHDVVQFQSDYKTVNGLVMAHSMSQVVDDVEAIILTVTEVTFNTGLDDSMFVMEK
jgi:outer membrane lipoprotein-sorting protein